MIAAANSEGWFGGFFEFWLGVIGTIFIWLGFFTIMYFVS